jgi:hypothetical protein
MFEIGIDRHGFDQAGLATASHITTTIAVSNNGSATGVNRR